MGRRSPCLTLFLVGVLSGCASPPDTNSTVTYRDSAGVVIASLPPLDKLEVPIWTAESLFSTAETDSIDLISVLDARFAADSTLVVSRAAQLLILDRRGRWIRTLGRDGAGPGEFRLIYRLGIGADGTLMAADFGSRRVTEMRLDGEVVRIVPRLGSPTVAAQPDPITLLEDGRILVGYWQQRPNHGRVPGIKSGRFERDSAPLTVYDSAGEPSSRLGLWRGMERVATQVQGTPSLLPARFGRTVLYRGRGNRTVIGSTDSVDISMYVDTVLTLRLIGAAPVARASGADIAAWERGVRAWAPDVADVYLDAIAAAPTPPALPAFGGLLVDDGGNVWVGAFQAPGRPARHWYVFAPNGRPRGRVDLPPAADVPMPGKAELLDVQGDRVALRRELEDGRIAVEVRRLIRQPHLGTP